MRRKVIAGHEEADLIRRANHHYAREAAVVVEKLVAHAEGGARDHLNAVKAGLNGQEPPKRTED